MTCRKPSRLGLKVTKTDTGAAGEPPCGLVVVDKPAGWTSHDVVAKCRGIFGTRKVGHSGTLDPMATGVLVLGVGRATKLLTFLTGLPKSYSAEITFGSETDTLDAEGDITASYPDMAAPTAESIAEAAKPLTGDIQQVPPMVSAVKVDGKRLHQHHREGRVVEREARPVTVDRFELSPTDDPMVWKADIDCSSGTYVRVLAADLGRALGGGAHLSALRRTSVGPFGIDEAAPMDSAEVQAATSMKRVLSFVTVGSEIAGRIANGAVLNRDEVGLVDGSDGPWSMIASDEAGDERLLAVYAAHRGDTVKPAFVMGP